MGRRLGRADAYRAGMTLLDTQVVVWLAFADRRLGRAARAAIQADREGRVSTIVSWEVAMSVDKGRIGLAPLSEWLEQTFVRSRLIEVPLTGAMARDAGSLPPPIHGDPCDRIMIATARALGCPLLTSDRKMLDYAALGHLKAIDARV